MSAAFTLHALQMPFRLGDQCVALGMLAFGWLDCKHSMSSVMRPLIPDSVVHSSNSMPYHMVNPPSNLGCICPTWASEDELQQQALRLQYHQQPGWGWLQQSGILPWLTSATTAPMQHGDHRMHRRKTQPNRSLLGHSCAANEQHLQPLGMHKRSSALEASGSLEKSQAVGTAQAIGEKAQLIRKVVIKQSGFVGQGSPGETQGVSHSRGARVLFHRRLLKE